MKKILKTILGCFACLTLAFSAIVFVGCGSDPCEKGHTPGEYQYSATHHWKECSVCDEEVEKEAHSFDTEIINSDNSITYKCVCGAKKDLVGGIAAESVTDFIAALNNSEITTIVITEDLTITETVNISKDITIDLKGNKISSNTKLFNITDGNVSIDNGEIEVAGGHALYVDGTQVNSDVTLILGEDLTVSSDNCAIFIKGPGSKLITAADLTATGPYATISGNGNEGNNVESITITGGTITHASTMAIYVPQTGEFNITGGTITGTTALYIKSGTINISGGTFVGTGDYTGYVYSGDGAKFFGDAVIIDACGYPGGNPTVMITGGTFTAQDSDGHGIGYYKYKENIAQISAEGFDIFELHID